MMFLPLVIVTLLLCVSVWWLLSQRSSTSMPWADGWLPVIGHLLALKNDPTGFVESHVAKYKGKPFMMQLMGNVFCVLGEEHLKIVQRAKAVEMDFDEVVFDHVLGVGLTHRNGMAVSDMTHIQILKNKFIPRRNEFIDMFVEVTRRTTEQLMQGKSRFQFDNIMDDFSLHVIVTAVTTALVGEEAAKNSVIHDALIAHSRVVEEIMRMSIAGMPRFLVARRAKRLLTIRAITDDYFVREIAKRRAKGEHAATADYLDALIWWPNQLSNDLILGYLETILGAAIMTTRQTMSQTLIDIAARPELQKALRDEVKRELAARGAQVPKVEVVNHLKLLEATIRESMRLRVGPMIPFRRLLVDLPIAHVGIIPKGTFVCMAASSIHKSNASFENASSYSPERWLGDETSADSHLSFLSFGAGSHKCPGRLFALGEMKTILATLLMDYQFSGGSREAKRGDQKQMIPIRFERA